MKNLNRTSYRAKTTVESIQKFNKFKYMKVYTFKRSNYVNNSSKFKQVALLNKNKYLKNNFFPL